MPVSLAFALALAIEPAQANISYDQHPETVLDVYSPASAGAKKRPAVIVIHGGGWVNGEKKVMIENFVEPYLNKGFVVINVEYRLAKAAIAPAAVQDVLNAAEWVRKNSDKYNIDSKRLIVTGSSAGGHLSLMVGMTPKSAGLGPTGKIAAIVNCWGITDVEDQIEGPGERAYAVQWIPPTVPERRQFARKLSPMTYVRKDNPPVFTIHSDTDQTVPYEQGIALTKALMNAKVTAELYCLRGAKHGFPPERREEIYSQVWPFLIKLGLMPE